MDYPLVVFHRHGHTVLPCISAIHARKPWQGTEMTTRSRCSSTAESGWAPKIRGGQWKEKAQRKKRKHFTENNLKFTMIYRLVIQEKITSKRVAAALSREKGLKLTLFCWLEGLPW